MPKIVDKSKFFAAVKEKFGNIKSITRTEIIEVCDEYNINFPNWLTTDQTLRVGRGVYALQLPENTKKKETVVTKAPDVDSATHVAMALAVAHNMDNPVTSISLVPEKASGYVPFGHFNDVRAIIKSGRFYPLYITGLSGNGKTMMVEQVCAAEKRECIRVNITIETDESDLLGGFRLVDGRTVWHNGPVIHAMERGAVLLLDEVDLGSNKMMCLQPVLEGKPVFLKKINKLITPMPGFNIVATANTKGKGSDDGRFIGTNVMNEAFLERFSITLEQEYPAAKIETKILNNVLQSVNAPDNEFAQKLVSWAEIVRKTFYDGAVSEIISTRRLVHICEAYGIFNKNREKAITLCLNRFDIDTKNSFMDLYKKLDESVVPETKTEPEEVPF